MGSLFLADEEDTTRAGAALASAVSARMMVYLVGDLGMGKTCFCRGLIRALGHQGNVKSPTFTLVEPYALDEVTVYHIDLYRLADPEELEFLGIGDYFNDGLCLVEWPELGEGHLPSCDLCITLSAEGNGRRLTWEASSTAGERLSRCLDRIRS